jgi:hypothetical protein
VAEWCGSLQAHKPEVCYPAQRFKLKQNDAGKLATALGEIPVRRLFDNLGAREGRSSTGLR